MHLECPNCCKKITVDADTFLNQKQLKCFNCMLTIELRNADGTLKHLKFNFDEERKTKESH